MEGTVAKVAVNKYNDALCLKLNINNKIYWHETRVNYDKISIDDLLFWWMLKSLKPLFFEMPMEKIDFTCSKDVYEQFGKIINNYSAIIHRTNDAIKSYSHLRGVAESNKNILFFNVDDNYRHKSQYERFRSLGTKDVLYVNMASGFNPKTRRWEDRDVPIPLSELVDIVVKKSIKKTVSINHYVLDRYLCKTDVYLIPLFGNLGVEYVIFDNDPWDGHPHGYLMKSFYNCNTFDRFTSAYVLSDYWDSTYELKNVHYITVPQNYKIEEEITEIKEDYAILVLSNPRLENVKPMIVPILYLLDHIPEGSVFTEVHLWYMSLRHIILRIMKLDEFERLYYNSRLHIFFYTIMQFLKYEIIDSIDTVRRIELYGDRGWERIFPEYYKKLLNKKGMDELFSKNGHLYLLLNHSFSYLNAGGPIYDAMSRNVPFINMPPLVKTRSFEGFRHIEYRNKEELNYLIENTKAVVHNEELKESIRILMKVLRSSGDEVKEKIVHDRNVMTMGGIYGKESKAHKVLMDQMVEEYIDRNERFLRQSFDVLILGKPVQYDISKSRYFNRKYVQRILKLITD